MIDEIVSGLFAARRLGFVLFLIVGLVGLTGCDLAKNNLKPDRPANLEVQDFRDGFAERLPDSGDAGKHDDSSSIPMLQPYVSQGSESMTSMPLVSISVNQSVSLRDVLFELAHQADYDLELDPGITGSVIFTARNRPFDEVVKRISDVAGLRYHFDDDVLRVELDTPYNKSYKVDYLSYIRKNSGAVNNSISVVSGDGADAGSSFSASSESEANFWGELQGGLTQILGGGAPSLRTGSDPRIVATEQNPDVEAVAPADGDGKVVVQPPDAVLRVDSLPVDNGSGGGAAGNARQQGTFAFNKQAGIVNVFASERAQKEVAEYLDKVRRSVTAQVLIEAKILEVTLEDEFATGIDWRALNVLSGEGAVNFLRAGTGAALDTIGTGTGSLLNFPDSSSSSSSFAIAFDGNDVQAVVEAVQQFGTVRALASPRMTVLNNQSAVLNVATNHVYFEVDIDVTNDGTTVQTDVSSDIKSVPVGVLVNVQPSVDIDRGMISLAVKPTVTKIDADIEDPGIAFVIAQCGAPCANLAASTVPQLNVQEIDSVIQVRSGQAIVMGGLLQDNIRVVEDGVPVLSEVPMVGALFRQHQDTARKTELVIFLKATILDSPADSIHDTDRDLYRKFSADRRPFKL